MIPSTGHEVRFAVVMKGYDQAQVDAEVERQERRASEARLRLEEAEKSLAEATSRAEELEAKVAELEERNSTAPGVAPLLTPLREVAHTLLDRVGEIGTELQARLASDAEVARQEAAHTAAELMEEARGRARALVAAARRDTQQETELVEEARRQLDLFLDEGRAAARERARVVWEEAQLKLREPVLEAERARRIRRGMLEEVAALHDQVDESWQRLIGDSPLPENGGDGLAHHGGEPLLTEDGRR